MIPEGNDVNNVERFSGFENDYDLYRPQAPNTVIEILLKYLGQKPAIVVDLGCGTGLSSYVWKGFADRIIGVEPNDDMRKKALEKLEQCKDASHISFMKGYSNQLELETGTIDIITCSQSFHWMDPFSTLKEVSRVLKTDGIFAAYDCDWPPTVNWRIEDQFISLIDKADAIINRYAADKKATKWDKEKHIKNMEDSRVFRFVKEIVFHNIEPCDAQRYIGLVLSQGGIQTVFKLGVQDLNDDIESFKNTVKEHFRGNTLDILFSYRMRLGIK
jgi:ubiquinone/menaquinone biosynthesis C-methylase UbiE